MTKRQKMERNQYNQRIKRAIILDECKNLFRILQAVQRRPLHFSQIKLFLNIKPARLVQLLKVLCKMFWIIPRAMPNKASVKFYELRKGQWHLFPSIPLKKCKILVEYSLSKRGASVLRALAK